jgi:hypothetical protein
LRARHNTGFGRYVQTGISHLPEVAISTAVQETGTIVKVQISLQPVRGAGDKIIAVEAMMSALAASTE